MSREVALSIGVKYALSRRSSISFISLVAVGGLALSVCVLVVVVSVINGFERELKNRVFGLLPHLTVYGRNPVEVNSTEQAVLLNLPGVEGVVPFVQGAGLAAVSSKAVGVAIVGIEPSGYGQVSDLWRYVEAADDTADAADDAVGFEAGDQLIAGGFGVLLGAGIARELQVSVGDRVAVVLPTATVTPAGLFPRQKRFTVQGIIRSQSEVDGRAAYIHLADAQRLFRLGRRVHGYQLRLHDLFNAGSVARAAVDELGGDRVFARTWMRTHGNLYRAIGVQKTTMFVLLSFLVAVAAFNLVSTLVMVVDQRSGDVAILRTLGGDTATVVGAFVLLGGTLGAAGVGLGIAAGVAIAAGLPGFYAWTSATFALDLMNQYLVSYLPVEIRPGDLVGISLTAMVLCVLSTLYPALRAAGLRPSEVLAHE